MNGTYERAHVRSLEHSEEFWAEAAEQIHWYKTWDRVLDDTSAPFYRWFTGGELNTCYNAARSARRERPRGAAGADLRQPGHGHDSRRSRIASFAIEVATCAGALAALGVAKGDRVIIYMPMIPEAVIAMLAVARLGAIHSVVFGGFAANELAARIDDARPKICISASCGIEPGRIVAYKPLLDRAIELARHKPERCIIYQRPMQPADLVPGRDLDWDEAVAGATRRMTACRSRRPTRSTSSTPPARPASRRASCATTAATRSRSTGR